ncbi:uncharacterized protein LOC126842701 isoform X2 [Adelges cooleyi]|uniref:uncharacterized protein LOC126842701 isoform X2 n=1 Tax=Adelges cooleyi TaxID=133065 RepID=UPI00218078A9|nr:uncharacterized protein LOC126842701 isoform X2 [Adelges cooleyi]
MTFPVVVKKSGPITISKTGSASKAMSPGSPASPINTSAKSTVKASPAAKATPATPVKKPSAAPKSPVAKPVTKPVSDAKPELAKTTSTSVAKDTTKTKPPPLKLNIKAAEAKAMPSSPATPKTVPKTPTTPTVKTLTASKSPAVVKSATAIKTTSTTSISKSPSVLSLTAKSPSTISKTSSASSPTIKSSTSTITKPTTPAAKSPSATTVSKATTATSTTVKAPGTVGVKPTTTPAAKSPTAVTKPSTPTSKTTSPAQKPLASKTPGTPTKPDAPKKLAVSSVKSVTGVKSPSSPAAKTSPLSRSSSIASSIKSVTVRSAASPSKPLASTVRSPAKTVTSSKTAVTTKPLTPTTLMKKEPSTLSLASVKSTATVKSTTSISSKTSAVSVKSTISKTVVPKSPVTKAVTKTAVPPKSPAVKASPTAAVSKTTVAPKSPAVKAAPTSTVSKTAVAPKSPAVKAAPTSTVSKTAVAPKSPVVKAAPTSAVSKTAVAPKSPAVKTAPTVAVSKTTVTPKSPAVKTAPASAVSKTAVAPKSPAVKTPSSPVVKKTTPAKPLSSLGLSKTKSLSSSRLSSVSTESLASRTSLKSPMSPRPTTGVKSAAKPIKKVEEPKVKGIRGGQPVKKTIEIPGITELPTIPLADTKQEVQDSLDVESSIALNDEVAPEYKSNEEIESTIAETLNQDQKQPEETAEALACNGEDDQVQEVSENNLETIVEDFVESAVTAEVPTPESSVRSCCSPIDFEVVQIEDCQPCLNGVTQSDDNFSIEFVETHFDTNEQAAEAEQQAVPESCVIDMDDQFEPMNDKLVLGDVPYETDSNKSDVSDHEQAVQVETTTADVGEETAPVDDNVFSFTAESVEENDRIEDFVEQFVCQQSMDRSEGPSSLSTDDGSLVSRKSYSEVVMGSPKDGEYYFDYDIELADDCLDDDEEEKPVFVEVTEKEFPELKPKDLSGKRKRMRKQKKRNYSCRTESQSDSYNCVPEIEYNPEDFDGNEFCHYIKMMKDCSFYPNGTFSSDSVKLSTSESLSWLDISVRTTDDDLRPSTELLSTYEVFQASNLSKDFLTSIIGSTTTTPTTHEPTWFWKSIEGRHQTHNKANITLSLQPRPKHLTTPRFMTLLALISEAKGYQIEPSLSEHFVTTDCMPRFNDKIKRLMVQGFWLVGRLINESLSEDEEVSCGNPFEFCDGDIGYWWAGINMLDWQEYMKKCGKSLATHNCYQFMLDENMEGFRHINNEAVSSMNAAPEDFMSELDVENFIHTVRNVKYYCGNCFVDSQENLEALNESCDSDSLVEWDNSTNNMSNESE